MLILGEFEKAHTAFQECIKLSIQSGFQQSYLWTSTQLGYLALREGRVTTAHTIFADAAKNFQKDQSAIGVAFAPEGMASLDIGVGYGLAGQIKYLRRNRDASTLYSPYESAIFCLFIPDLPS